MPGLDDINSIIDESAVKLQFDRLFDQLQKTVDFIKKINTSANQINLAAGLQEATRAAAEARAATEELKRQRAELARQEAATRAAAAATTAQAQQAAQAQAAATQSAIDAERIRREAARAAEAAARAAATQARNQQRNTQNAAGSLNDLRQRLRDALRSFDAMGEAERNAFGRQRIEEIRNLTAQVRNLEQSTGRYQRNVGNYANSIIGGTASFLGKLGLGLGVAEIVKSTFDATVALDSQSTALKNVSKNSTELIRNQIYLRDISDRLGLKITDVTTAFKSFYAAATEAGLSANSARAIFSSATAATSTLRLSQEDTNGVLNAFSQILGKGKVQAEELRGQIGERIPGAFAIAARSIGVTQAELNKMLEQGQVVAGEFLPKFAAELEKTFGGDANQKVIGLQASINRLSNALTELVSSNSSGLATLFGSLIDFLTESIKALDNFTAGISYVILKFRDLKQSQEFLNSRAVNEYAEGLKKLSVQQVVDQLSAVNKNLNAAEHAAIGAQKDLDLAAKIGGAMAENIDEYKNNLRDAQIDVDRLTKLQVALQAEIDKRLPKGDDLNKQEAEKNIALTKAQIAAQQKLEDRYRKALFEQQKFDLMVQIENQKAIIDNDKNAYLDRANALDNYYQLKNQLASLDAKNSEEQIKAEIQRGKAQGVELQTNQKKLNYEKNKINIEYEELNFKILSDAADKRTKKILDDYKKEKEALEANQNEELKRNQAFYDERKISQEQYELEKIRITNRYAILQLEAELIAQQAILDLQKKRGEDVDETESKILEIRNRIRELDLKYHDDVNKLKTKSDEDSAKKRLAIEKKQQELVKQLRQEGVKAFTALFTAQYEKQKNAVQDQIDELDKLTNKEIEAVNNSTASQQEKADKIAVINARSAAQKEQLERKQRQIDQQRARFERLQSIAQIVAQTAVNIVKVFPNPVLIALAAAVGAAQLAQVLATPIPKYAQGAGVDGRPEHPGGLMMVNDGGKIEPIESPNGQLYVSHRRNAVISAEKGTKVYKDFDQLAKIKKLRKEVPSYSAMPAFDGTGALAASFEHQTSRVVQAVKDGMVNVQVLNTYSGLITTERRVGKINKWIGAEIQFGKRK